MTHTIRQRLRDKFFTTLDRTFATNDGRDIAVRALEGLLTRHRAVPQDCALPVAPYRDLGTATPARTYEGTVFITARFRTGSTLLWRLFRDLDDCVAYYEPLNERQWFNPNRRGTRLDHTHRGVDDYWREYDGLTDLIGVYREEWVDRDLVLDADAWAPALRRYIDRLIEHAGPRRAVLQFNRVDFRLPWLRRQFPGVSIVHLYRHPREQWCSTLVEPGRVPRELTMSEFEPFDHFYLARWARDLSRHFPFLSTDGGRSPYQVFYLIWKLSFMVGALHADHTLSFEALTSAPTSEVQRLLDAVGMRDDTRRLATLVEAAPASRRHEYASDDWYSRQESACETVLAEYFRRASAISAATKETVLLFQPAATAAR